MQEAYALAKRWRLFSAALLERLAGSKVLIDNKTRFHVFCKGRETCMRKIIKLFRLQVDADCTLDLRWVCSAYNSEADALSWPEAGKYVRLGSSAFRPLWDTSGPFDIYLMTTPRKLSRSQCPTPPQAVGCRPILVTTRREAQGWTFFATAIAPCLTARASALVSVFPQRPWWGSCCSIWQNASHMQLSYCQRRQRLGFLF